MVKNVHSLCLFLFLIFFTVDTYSQHILTLKDAISIAIKNYGTLKAKSSYIKASAASVVQSRKEYLPDLNVSMQQDYGTVNGQNGILYGYRGLSALPSGPAMDRQNWNAAFGSLYLTNINWDFFLPLAKHIKKCRQPKQQLHRMRQTWRRNNFSTRLEWPRHI